VKRGLQCFYRLFDEMASDTENTNVEDNNVVTNERNIGYSITTTSTI
jgi:hypothetical protein